MKGIASTRRIIRICVYLSICTSSFDIFANITIAGFNIRFCQFILLPAMLILLLNIVQNGRIPLCLGFSYLLIWTFIQFAFTVRSPNVVNAVGYDLWLLFNVITVYLIYYYMNIAYTAEELMRVYLNSFYLMAILGFVQFLLAFFDINFFVKQFWRKSLARINGFTYEPSYYATYMLLGFVMYAYLIEKKDISIMGRRELLVKFTFITIVLLLSSSRMGWLMMAVWLLVRSMRLLVLFIFQKKLTRSKMIYAFYFFPLIVGVLFIIWNMLFKNGAFSFMVNGLGLYGKASHSVFGRLASLLRAIEIFKKHPWLGVSLGGVDPLISQYSGRNYVVGNNGSTMLIGELLIASGIIGIIPFLQYIETLLCKARCWTKSFEQYSLANIYRATEWALIFELAILCFNQNILRMYLWIHIGILCALHKINHIKKDV